MTDGPEKTEISFQPHQHQFFRQLSGRTSIKYAVTSPLDHFVHVKATAKQGNRIACDFSFSSADNLLFVTVRKREK
jgi:hypothetical protein